ncbi:hypothetical protein B1992_08380 [Pseudoxanthomonas broegbernensis]|uniref:DUF418 domain-containing protein n=1 Tax=Pseudoxanthomonas broegbernensis TaxID=83619 RepID=A0A7V8K6R5_9GAMM|nr:DUF418 domain-containing protein [Pseudoxanthomonas broegbernensis]KAF1686240.1 hypothetical protein B1992_08380 [Pseudoxanthomonas broegbernensis]MBB6063911.1 uncharacterized protein [Pseudoxanthomonas broegbernensis]
MPTPPLQPIAPDERIALLDALRGFALCGILLMNMEGFAGPLLASTTGLDPSLRGADRVADALVYFFVQGKFFTLFSLLFGMGFAAMSQRAEAAGRPFAGAYWRRGLALLGIGLVHGVLVWSGDILVMYALLSFLLLAFRPAPSRWLAWLGALACLAAPAMILALGGLAWLMSLSPDSAADWNRAMAGQGEHIEALIQSARQAYAAGGYADAVAQRVRELGTMLSALPVVGPLVFGMFLLGAAFVRGGAIAAPGRHAGLFAWLRWGALPLGLLAMGSSFAIAPSMPPDRFDPGLALAQALGMLAGGLMCLGYVGWLVRAFGTRIGARVAAWLAPAGRMALTNYLMQSVVCTLVFYHYGLGFFERLPRAWQVPFALVLFALQVPASRLWLARFRFGPAEWLWRSLIYLCWQPMRVRGAAPR